MGYFHTSNLQNRYQKRTNKKLVIACIVKKIVVYAYAYIILVIYTLVI